MPVLVIVAGPNGSGKTTLVRTGGLTGLVDVPSICINADDIARMFAAGGLPSDDRSLYAAQVCDALLDEQIASGRSVVVETVLSSDKFKTRVLAARQAGFQVVLIHVSVKLADLNIGRVANRFTLGGHPVPVERIIARRARSHQMSSGSRNRPIGFSFSTTGPRSRPSPALRTGTNGRLETLGPWRPTWRR